MKAVVHHTPSGFEGLKVTEMKEAVPGRGEVKIRLKTAGLNRRDLRVLQLERDTDDPVILGSDGAGVVERVGDGVSGVKEGDEVVVNPSLNWPHRSVAPLKVLIFWECQLEVPSPVALSFLLTMWNPNPHTLPGRKRESFLWHL